MGLREENKARTRNALADTARALILARGFDDVTVTEITREVGISRRTFFRYFPTKEAAFFSNQEERLELFYARLAERLPEESPFDHIRRVCLEMAQGYIDDRELMVAQYRITMASRHLLAYDMKFDVEWENAVRETLERRGIDPESARVQAGAIIGVVRAQLRHWFQQNGEPDLMAIGVRAFELLRRSQLGLS